MDGHLLTLATIRKTPVNPLFFDPGFRAGTFLTKQQRLKIIR
jgi:hypothetical protein